MCPFSGQSRCVVLCAASPNLLQTIISRRHWQGHVSLLRHRRGFEFILFLLLFVIVFFYNILLFVLQYKWHKPFIELGVCRSWWQGFCGRKEELHLSGFTLKMFLHNFFSSFDVLVLFCYYHTFSLVLWDCWGSWCGGFCGWKEEKLRFSGFISWFIFFIIFCSASFDIGGGRVSRIGCFHWRDGQRQTGWLCASCVQTCRAQGSRKGFFFINVHQVLHWLQNKENSCRRTILKFTRWFQVWCINCWYLFLVPFRDVKATV